MTEEGLAVQVARDQDGGILAFRLQHRERVESSSSLDPIRNWRTDVTVGRDDDGPWLAVRQWYAGLTTDARRCRPPRFVADLWRRKALSDVLILEGTCWRLEYEEEVDKLVSLIHDVDRTLPVVVLADGNPLNADILTRDLLGLAHVCEVSRERRFKINEALGSHGLDHGSIRTFYPIVDDRPLLAPAARWRTVINWEYGGQLAATAFASWLHDEIGKAVVASQLNDPAHRTYEEVRSRNLQIERRGLERHVEDAFALRESLRLAVEERELLELELQDARAALKESSERASRVRDEKAEIEELLREESKRNYGLQADKAALQAALNAKTGAGPIVWDEALVEKLIREQPRPETTFDALDQASRLYQIHGVDVVVSPEAEDGAMEALHFKRPAEVQEVLIRIGFLWNRIRENGSKRLDVAATEGLKRPTSLFESDTTMRNYGHQRTVHVGGAVVTLEKHVKLGSGSGDDGARIYFGDKDGQIVIGHVGRHLDIASTK